MLTTTALAAASMPALGPDFLDPDHLIASFGTAALLGIAVVIFIPFFRRGGLTSAFEYLGHRFGVTARLYGTVGFIVLTYFVIVGTSNAVNLTDGLDGLAIE